MGKFLKIVAGLLVFLVVLVLAAMIVLPQVIDPNDYKDEIVAEVKKATGRDLSIGGDIDLSVFPWLGLKLGSLELSNAKGFGGAPFAAIKEAGVRVKLMPLLSRRVEVDTVVLDGLRLNLARTKEGRTNWDDLVAAGEAKPGKEAPGPEAAAPGEAPQLAGLAIGGVDISDARINWKDEASGQEIAIRQFNVKMGAIAPGKPVDLDLGFLLDSQEPPLQAKIELSGSPLLDPDAGRLSIAKLILNVDAQGEALQGKGLKARLETGLETDLAGNRLSLTGLHLDAGGLALKGNIQGKNLATAPAFSGDLALAELDLREWLGEQGLPVPETADPKVLTRVALALELGGTANGVNIEKLALTLDDTRLTGNLKVGDLAAAMPAVGFNLNVDAIDLDRYLPPPAEEATAPEAAPPAEAGEPGKQAAPAGRPEQGLIPVETLRQLNIDGVFKVGRLVVKKLLAEEIELTVKARDGVVDVGQQIKQFYQGSLQGKTNIDVRGKEPKLQLREKMENIQAGPLLKDLTGQDRLTGTGRFNLDLKTRGDTDPLLRRNLNGDLGFRFEDGAVKGINLAQLIRDTKAKFSGRPVTATDAPPQTDFSELGGTAVITNGVLTNKDLLAKSPFLRVTGAGTVNLVEESLDYRVKTVIVGSMEGQGGKELEELKGVPVPVHITGTFAEPQYSINWAEVLTGTQKAKLEEKKEEVKQKVQKKLDEKLKGKLPGDVKDRLKGLFR